MLFTSTSEDDGVRHDAPFLSLSHELLGSLERVVIILNCRCHPQVFALVR
jgi:hypothetical protein